ncbi:hypothetical protein BKP64_16100 [Marinobacter salinus]|uniref:Phospholipase/carboxylesterase/thioesterase domain-containing protein n=2 Tax=Marinobacter salinus TaxID=1874317 RepID=A0A1D9GPL3_9GAMM|nr:hypothetical protein BKP64_16100 [Marinobacter salinus]
MHFTVLSREVDHAFIGGFSLGGALATEYALSDQKPRPEGLIALAPAWQPLFMARPHRSHSDKGISEVDCHS